MGFWNYLGMAIVARNLFGRKNRQTADYGTYTAHYDAEMFRDREREAELDARVSNLSDRISSLESRLDGMDPSSRQYAELYDDIETLRDDLDDIETDLE